MKKKKKIYDTVKRDKDDFGNFETPRHIQETDMPSSKLH